MKPVETTDLKVLVDLGSILILDVTLWGTSFIYQTICRSPSCITTKTRNKGLPAEIWLQILSWAEYDVNTHTYKAIYPIHIGSIQTNGGEVEPALICNRLEEWRPCGKLECANSLRLYEKYLKDPSYEPTEREKECVEQPERPFHVSSIAKDPTYLIPISQMETRTKFLFHKIEVPDMISWLEYGQCCFCASHRRRDAGCWNFEELTLFVGEIYEHKGCYCSVLCPLCIGVYYAEVHLEEACPCLDDEDRMTDEEYAEFKGNRFRELGYGW